MKRSAAPSQQKGTPSKKVCSIASKKHFDASPSLSRLPLWTPLASSTSTTANNSTSSTSAFASFNRKTALSIKVAGKKPTDQHESPNARTQNPANPMNQAHEVTSTSLTKATESHLQTQKSTGTQTEFSRTRSSQQSMMWSAQQFSDLMLHSSPVLADLNLLQSSERLAEPSMIYSSQNMDNFRGSEVQKEITQVGMPEVQASPGQTAGLLKFSWFSQFSSLEDAKLTFRDKIKKPCKKQRALTYKCGYCSVKKSSTSTGKDGLVRIQCECGGKHQDSKPRLHARWFPET